VLAWARDIGPNVGMGTQAPSVGVKWGHRHPVLAWPEDIGSQCWRGGGRRHVMLAWGDTGP